MPSAIDQFLSLVRQVLAGTTARSENELSRRFADVLEELELHTIVDTGQAGGKRPDILGYRSQFDATLALAAEIVVEAKQPGEVSRYRSLAAAMTHGFWISKTIPYVLQNLPRIRYFVFTSFTDFAILRITEQVRTVFATSDRASLEKNTTFQAELEAATQLLSLGDLAGPKSKAAGKAWARWLTNHLAAKQLGDIPLSQVGNTVAVKDEKDLDVFTEHLVTIAAGRSGSAAVPLVGAGLFGSVKEKLPKHVDDLDGDTKRDLHLFVMSQNPATDMATVKRVIDEDPVRWYDDFIGASIHSLVSRLFALNIIEGGYCIGESAPLIEQDLWVINTKAYDKLSADQLLDAVTKAIRKLKNSKNTVVKGLAVFGAFFDWIEKFIDPILFRSLFELFVIHDFRSLEADLLGRFFEIYSQQINSAKRKALGQYYTPLPVVRFMWHLVWKTLKDRPVDMKTVTVLDPGMGSAMFLKEGAHWFGNEDIPNFWERLVGFDLSPQVMGIAQVNLYMAVLANLHRLHALDVGDLRLFTTDALDPRNGRYLKDVQPLFDDATHKEFLQRVVDVSANIKRKEHFSIVIGNPPYKNNSVVTLAKVAERFPRLLNSSVAASASKVRNIRDDYAWFFAAADSYSNESGLICFITSDSYTRKPSYRFFREELLRHYQVLTLVRLGERVFSDVSPRLSFAIILLEKRATPLVAADDAKSFPYVDLRPLIADFSSDQASTKADPRFLRMLEVVRGSANLPPPVQHTPTRAHDFLLISVEEDVVKRVLTDSVPTTQKKGERIFMSKWPGIITAADSLLKAKDLHELDARASSFFAAAHKHSNPASRRTAIEQWISKNDLKEKEIARLAEIADFIGAQGIKYDPSKIKRSFSGSIPNSVRWYPPPEFQHVIYYEPAIHIERVEHEGKDKGWGYMGQWREPQSHLIKPKLVFTTSANPKSGFKSFVLDDEWYVKLHGGTSQQYHYTGLTNPLKSETTSGVENNLASPGEAARNLILNAGGVPEDLLHYIAAVYNSALAEEFHKAESGHDLQIRLPSTDNIALVRQLANMARRLRDLHYLLYDRPKGGVIAAADLERLASASVLAELGLTAVSTKGGKFKASRQYHMPDDFERHLRQFIEDEQSALDDSMDDLYS